MGYVPHPIGAGLSLCDAARNGAVLISRFEVIQRFAIAPQGKVTALGLL